MHYFIRMGYKARAIKGSNFPVITELTIKRKDSCSYILCYDFVSFHDKIHFIYFRTKQRYTI